MKKLFTIITAVLLTVTINAQEKSDSKITETSFEVKGVCKMCKKRIEDAAMRTSGVKLAEWNKETKELKVVYKNTKTTEKEIHQSIADYGHATSLVKADSTAYKKLPNCCMYDDGAKCSH